MRVSQLTLELPVLERPGTGQVVAPVIGRGADRGFLLLRVKPRRLRAGRMTRFRVTVYSHDCKGCRAERAPGVRVLFAGRRADDELAGPGDAARAAVAALGTRKMRAMLSGFRLDSERIRVMRAR